MAIRGASRKPSPWRATKAAGRWSTSACSPTTPPKGRARPPPTNAPALQDQGRLVRVSGGLGYSRTLKMSTPTPKPARRRGSSAEEARF